MTPRLAIIGLDSSHCIEFTRILHAHKMARVVTALRFPSAFQSETGQDARARLLEDMGVRVTTDLSDAVVGGDALMLLINDPALHLDWGLACSEYGLPLFIDKPFADSMASGRALARHLNGRSVRVMSASSLRSAPELNTALQTVRRPDRVWIYGPLGRAPAGSSVIWYGVHAFEMLHRALDAPAAFVRSVADSQGAVALLETADGRRGVVELTRDTNQYGGCLRDGDRAACFTCDVTAAYQAQMRDLVGFLQGAPPNGDTESALSVLAMLETLDQQLAAAPSTDHQST